MNKVPLLFVGFLFIMLFAKAQTVHPHGYKDIIFSDVRIDKDLSYAANINPDDKKAWLFDLYQPKDDHAGPRPLIVWVHGGGFKFGTKEAEDIQLWCKTFAQRGYLCAAINYRLSKKNPLLHFNELQKGCYYAVQDLKMAFIYFKQCHAAFNIDTDKIILAGNSAGGLTAMQAAYCTDGALAKMAGIADTSPNNKGLLKAACVINFWGAIFDTGWLKNARVPIVSVLGDKDSVIPPTHKSGPLYGGEDIHKQADALGIPNELKVFEGYSHELRKNFNPLFQGGKATQERWLEAGQFAADFLYTTLFKY
jgi:acetyl esterase/lipase